MINHRPSWSLHNACIEVSESTKILTSYLSLSTWPVYCRLKRSCGAKFYENEELEIRTYTGMEGRRPEPRRLDKAETCGFQRRKILAFIHVGEKQDDNTIIANS